MLLISAIKIKKLAMRKTKPIASAYPVYKKKALLIEDSLIVADLHIGIEREFAERGISVPSQTEKMKKEILSLLEKTSAEVLVVLGDLKHKIPLISCQEMREVPVFVEEISKNAEVRIIKGNHDGNIEKLLSKSSCKISAYEVLGDAVLAHGHAWIRRKDIEEKLIVLAHAHPCITFKDEFDRRTKEEVWVRSALTEKARERHEFKKAPEVIIMPAFNKLVSGAPINERMREELIGPYLSSGAVDMVNAEIYTLDGICLGKLGDLGKLPDS